MPGIGLILAAANLAVLKFRAPVSVGPAVYRQML